ncbi:MAG TPA: type II toxin-antitoxin system prevent-host-death family antitoxin [Pyrinomonadaceae bacterium]|nr:type II toxin-antitoxin system prevent-host-death family antitoxin [Pyrinomonadaceae bacterium]
MTTVVSIEEAQTKLKGLLALAREGDEIVIEENGEEIGTITPTAKRKSGKKRIAGLGREGVDSAEKKQRVLGLGRGTIWMSEDFNDELPDEFWGFDKEL